MKCVATLFLSVSLVSLVACKKKEEAKPGDPAKSAEKADPAAKEGAPAPAAATACPDGSTKNEDFNFCVKLPPKFEELKARRKEVAGVQNLTYADPAAPDDGFDIEVYTAADRFESSTSMVGEAAKNPEYKNAKQVDIANGGKFVTYDNAQNDRYTISWAKGTKTHVVCRTRHNTAFANAALDEVCKSLVVL